MLRLNINSQNAQEVVLAVYGKVAGPAVPLLKQGVENHLQTCRRVILDLDGVLFIDATGITWLQAWAGSRLALRGGSPFLQALLTGEGIQIEPTD